MKVSAAAIICLLNNASGAPASGSLHTKGEHHHEQKRRKTTNNLRGRAGQRIAKLGSDNKTENLNSQEDESLGRQGDTPFGGRNPKSLALLEKDMPQRILKSWFEKTIWDPVLNTADDVGDAVGTAGGVAIGAVAGGGLLATTGYLLNSKRNKNSDEMDEGGQEGEGEGEPGAPDGEEGANGEEAPDVEGGEGHVPGARTDGNGGNPNIGEDEFVVDGENGAGEIGDTAGDLAEEFGEDAEGIIEGFF